MNRIHLRIGALGATLLLASEARANPVYIGSPLPATTASITAIVAEVVVAGLVLRAFRRQTRSFLAMAIGMHLITYPAFLGLCVLFGRSMNAEASVASGEAVVVVVESIGYLVYCRKTKLESGFARCVVAAAAGNLTSFVVGILTFMAMVRLGLHS